MPGSGAGFDFVSDNCGRGVGDDRTAEAIVRLLRSEGARRLRHAGKRELLDHLVGTYRIVRCWGQSIWLQHAALIHSVYGTDAYAEELFPLSRRHELVAVAGSQAERLAYLFCVTPRGPLLAGTHRWAHDLPSRSTGGASDGARDAPTRDELDALVLLHMANLAEQTRAGDGSPGRWLVRLVELAELLGESESVTPPVFALHLAGFWRDDESLLRWAYRDAIGRGDDAETRASRFALAAAVCQVVAEPCIWLAAQSRWKGDVRSSRSWAACARKRILELGTPWDKRLTFDDWLTIIDALEQPSDCDPPHVPTGVAHPWALFEALVQGNAVPGKRSVHAEQAIKPPDAVAGRRRFDRYVEGLAGADGPGSGAIYPDLPSRPWHNAEDFPLVSYLESNYQAIREEIMALDVARFHRESERIKRTGDWDVAFLYERGRRHDEVCALCPVTTRGIEMNPTMRTAAGLIYVSRMRGSTHIQPHRGPTNLRVRCHLALEVPEGDCAIRVGEQTRQWQEGKCLVFDDYFDHEAWNHTEESRTVLMIDMWHPGLSATEVTLLEGLHNYTYAHAKKLSRYWSANATAAHAVTTTA